MDSDNLDAHYKLATLYEELQDKVMKEYTTLSEEFNKLSPERQASIKARASQIHLEELTLKYVIAVICL